MRLTILGCGTSGGVPRIGNDWGDCDPNEPRNRRRRASVAVETGQTRVIVDTSPDFRDQCLDAGIDRLDGVIFTHDHADHCHGIDDLRFIAYAMRRRIDVYSDQGTLDRLRRRFGYCFETPEGSLYPPIVRAHAVDGPFSIGDLEVIPFKQNHGDMDTLGLRFGPIAYSTDVVALDEAAFATLDGVRVWVVDALRHEYHPTHANLETTLKWIERVKPQRAVLTHMNFELDYQTLRNELPAGIEPAYDGMVIDV